MPSLYSLSFPSAAASAKALKNSSSRPFPKSLCRVSWNIRACSRAASVSESDATNSELPSNRRSNYAGVHLDETVDINSKLRLDSWISSRITGVSRARVQSSIRAGLVNINGRVIDKVSQMVRTGDCVVCTISELQPLKAEPENIPLDIVYEDEHVLVVNKPAHMVVHPAPGNPNGTLVNGILHHCSLPTATLPDEEILSDNEDLFDELNDLSTDINSSAYAASVRPGIVHRLDKGTSGLIIVAKDEQSHAGLSEQFKKHSIRRVYISLTCGVPSPASGRIDIPIGRDPNNRIRMAAIPGSTNSRKARYAASRYRVLEVLARGSSALVQWQLETGRTHQIRAHAKHLGFPLLGDEVYGGTKSMVMGLIRSKLSSNFHNQLMQVVSHFDRPYLHAMVLGFKHPHTGEEMDFSCEPPADFADILSIFRETNA
ncbi:RNA pseudouridine synthase 2, chloroplastic [Impatiens glandulifera]|uniref:RNA pseudouridine synthase 2, chloroplastic n=1 Tax=Impatiens glandulifera TaxID=253017 RepID=UPI001FB17590|nr:RNA pseudouridine synthase 2, chloroplastic [Impatiens glandulifera]